MLSFIGVPRPSLALFTRFCLVVPLLAAATGCVPRAEYDRLNVAHGNSMRDREDLNAKLMNERARAEAIAARYDELSAQLGARDSLIAGLRDDNGRLTSANARLQELLEKLANQPPTEIVKVVQNQARLPEQLDSALKSFATQYPDYVEYDSNRGIVRFKSDLTFALGSWQLNDAVKPALAEFARIVNSPAAQAFDVLVIGHTDNVPVVRIRNQVPTNWHLSAFRSIAVLEEMLTHGLVPARCGIVGHGEFRPIAPNTQRGNQQNRRVEIYLVDRSGSTTPAAPEPDALSDAEGPLDGSPAVTVRP